MSVDVAKRSDMFNEAFRAAVIADYEAGMSYVELERKYGVSGASVTAFLYQAGKRPNRNARVAPSTADFNKMLGFLAEQEEMIHSLEATIEQLEIENARLRERAGEGT